MNNLLDLLNRLSQTHSLTEQEYAQLVLGESDLLRARAAELADKARREYYGNGVFLRGLVEVGNICRNDCYYCGIRRSNKCAERYVLGRDEILECCDEGYTLGFRTFVLQGGEGVMPVDEICKTVKEIKSRYPDCAVTLSFGEYAKADYEKMFLSGADRYLLRHETADNEHYRKLHPDRLSLKNRINCLKNLKEIGFQVGCGFMVGSPYQTAETLAKDLKFIEEFSPDMCGIGPFIPHSETPFRDFKRGGLHQTLYLLSLVRLIKPNILLPATTALGTIADDGRERGILAGANVVMPNLSPIGVRKKYELYENKICTGEESAQCRDCLEARLKAIGFETVTARGDIIPKHEKEK